MLLMVREFDVIVLGAGPGGLTVAESAACLGFKIAVIDRTALGDQRATFGDISSKVLVKAANLMRSVSDAEHFGITASVKSVDFPKLIKSLLRPHELLGAKRDEKSMRRQGIEFITGEARFIDAHQVQVGDETFYGKYLVIATGSTPIRLKIDGSDEVHLLNVQDILSLKRLPKSIAVVGGGPVGCEMAQAFARLGSKVTLVQSAQRIMVKEEPELSSMLSEILTEEGINVATNARIKGVRKRGAHEKVLIVDYNGQERGIICEEVLLTAGRSPNVHAMDLERAGVKFTDKGIVTNDRLQTSTKHIYACGDVRGGFHYRHTASFEGSVVIDNILFHRRRKADYSSVPWVTFTEPELARVGMTEQQAKESGIAHEIVVRDYSDLDRAVIDHKTKGRVKLIVDKEGLILGAHILGPHAGETLHEIYLAMKQRISLNDIAQVMHVYPCWAQIIKMMAESYRQQHIYTERTKRFLRVLNRFF